MSVTKLGLFNGALRLCKERKLSSLTESREPRRLLDDAYGDGSTTGAVTACLQMGQWTFAMRAAQLSYSPSIEPDFGYRRAFDQPTDLIRVSALCGDEYFTSPLTQYADERGYWYADLDTIYVRYVSSHASYGADLANWPESFAKLVEGYLAFEICGSLTGADPDFVTKVYKQRKKDALSLDAMNKPAGFAPMGSWASARHGHRPRIRYSLP